MLKIITTLTLFFAGQFAQSQPTQTLLPFTKIEVTDGIEVIYSQSQKFGFDYGNSKNVAAEISSGILKIHKLKGDANLVKVYVTAPSLSAIAADSKAKVVAADLTTSNGISILLSTGAIFSGNLKSQKIDIRVRSGSTFNARIDALSLYCRLDSGAAMILSGSASETAVRAEKNAICHARNFISDKATIHADDFSSVFINTRKQIDVAMDETSKVIYYGNPLKVKVPYNATVNVRKNGDELLTSN